MKTIEVRTRGRWRQWLATHHATASAIWLIFNRGRTGTTLSYEDAVRQALCYGWIDSLVKRLDDTRYARKFTPRRAGSRWSSINRRRYAELKKEGLLTPAGLARAPTARSGDAPRPASAVPRYIEERLRASPAAWRYFERLAPSYRRLYVVWIDAAKRPETKERRLAEALGRLAAGKKLGLK